MKAHTVHQDSASLRSGLLFGIACYGIWGVLPLYLIALEFASALEVVAHRALWTAVICLGILAARRSLGELRDTLRHGRQMAFLGAAAALIAVNWLVYVYAANQREVLQASLGYFINPLLTVLLGVFVLRERLRPAQWVAMAIAGIAVTIIAVGYGHLPWLALALAGSFGLYGLMKSFAGRRTGAVTSLAIETLLLAPFALLALNWLHAHGDSHFLADGWRSTLLLASTGIVTATPTVQSFYDPDGHEGLNAVARIEDETGGNGYLWVDRISSVERLPNPTPPQPSARSAPPDPNAPAT